MSTAPAVAVAPRRFYYHADGLALGGRITAPVPADIVSQAVTTLPTVGGIATANSGPYSYGDFSGSPIVTVDAGGSEVSGSDNSGGLDANGNPLALTFTTRSRAEVTNLNVLNVLTATSVTGELFSTQTPDSPEIDARPTGSSFIQNLRINNRPVNLTVNPLLFNCGTVNEMVTALSDAGRGGPPAHFALEGATPALAPFDAPQGGTFNDCAYVTTIFEGVDFPIEVCRFGRVYLGELLITRYVRVLTMIRIELEVPAFLSLFPLRLQGQLVVASVRGDGHTY